MGGREDVQPQRPRPLLSQFCLSASSDRLGFSENRQAREHLKAYSTPRQLGVGNRQHDRRPLEKPSQRYLHWFRVVGLSNCLQHLSRGSTRSQWKPRNEGYLVALTMIDDVVPLPIGKAVAVLYRNDGNNFTDALNVFLSDIRKPDQPNLSLVAQRCQSLDGCLKRD